MTQPPPPPVDPTQPVTPVSPGTPPPPPPSAPPTAPPQEPTTVLPPPPAQAPAQPPAAARPPADRAALARTGLAVLTVALTVLGLAVPENDVQGYEVWTTWSVFATVAAAVHLLPLVWRTEPRRVWDVVAVATGALAFWWVAVVLPVVSNATGLVLTLAVACAASHLWLLPGRRG